MQILHIELKSERERERTKIEQQSNKRDNIKAIHW